MPKARRTETFTEMRDRLMDVHGWSRKLATIATRYYLNVENPDDLGFRTQEHPIIGQKMQRPDLSLAEAHEIALLR